VIDCSARTKAGGEGTFADGARGIILWPAMSVWSV